MIAITQTDKRKKLAWRNFWIMNADCKYLEGITEDKQGFLRYCQQFTQQHGNRT